MLVNNKELSEYGGKLLANYTINGCELENVTFKGRDRSSFHVLNSTVGLKTLKLPIIFRGKNRSDASQKKSMFEQAALGKNELVMDDGLLYTVVLSTIGNNTYIGEELIETEYVFTGFRHGERKTVSGNTVHCDSTLPYTDCILTATVTNDTQNYKIGSVTFASVTAGDMLCVDGINGRILVNGVPAAERADWIEFPKLIPGINEIQCNDILTIEFYPVYF